MYVRSNTCLVNINFLSLRYKNIRNFTAILVLVIIQGVKKKKLHCINHALGTMPIGQQFAHYETQFLSFIVLQFL